MADQIGNQSNQGRRPDLLKMDFPQTSSPSAFTFRPLPSHPTIDKFGAATATNRPKMTLPPRNQIQNLPSMNSVGKLQINGSSYDFTSEDLQDLGEIGKGGRYRQQDDTSKDRNRGGG
ncbi:hypothetical protein NQ317_015845 [Molorchus minor]|uniref:Uncharacterized protein n=1 Tax=Molorchus minor TaxID=1323400 RepID=A0ABQ9JMF4_9CUCU|nr:hypothetical protein NQ317_015845 [Molorchus minor]